MGFYKSLISTDFQDAKLMHLVNDNRDFSKVRNLFRDSIDAVESGNVLVGLDIADLEKFLCNYKELYVGMVNSKDASSSAELVEMLIKSAKGDISNCNSVYLYLEGDLSLMDANDVATSLEEMLGEEVYIVFTASYSEMTPDEYDVMALFLDDRKK